MSIGDPLAAMRRNMRAFYALFGEFSPGGILFRCDGLLAAIVPSCPDESIVNGVVYETADALTARRDELEAAYREAGVRSWRVWVPDRAEEAREVGEWLESRGHRLTATPRAMTLDLVRAEIEPPGVDPAAEPSMDLRAVASLNEQAYGLPDGQLTGALSGFAQDHVRVYLAHERDQPASCVVTVDADADCGIYAVATRPSSQGRGLASSLMRRALIEARHRGCRSSSLQASPSGFPVYARLGYRDVCAMLVWER